MSKKSDFISALRDREYQNRRNKMLFDSLEKDEEKLKKKLTKLYKSEGSNLDKQIAQYYTIYGKDNVIEYRNLLRKLSDVERDLLIKDIDTFINKYPQFDYIKAVRESIYKLDRLEGLRVSIEMQQMELAGKENELIEKHLIDTYSKGVMDSLNRLGHGTNFNTFDKNVARKFINKGWIDGKSLSSRIYNNRSKVAKYMSTQFISGVIRGDTYYDISKNLISKFGETSSKQAMRLVRTEGTRVMNEATITVFENEFEEYRYSAIFDKRTSQICKSLDGRVFKMKDRQAGVNFPPMHPNCRSSYDIEIPKNWMELAQEKSNGEITDVGLAQNGRLNFDADTGKVISSGVKSRDVRLDLSGFETSNGITITGISKHFNERLHERGLNTKDTIDALKNPMDSGKIKYNKDGIPSMEFIGKWHRIQINPETGKIITGWKTSSKLRRKYLGDNYELEK